ncbi:MAG: phosphoribosyltransferase [Thermoproteota archaeon]|nr:phosphoribosyltransferase [Thermoproteota archaeon]
MASRVKYEVPTWNKIYDSLLNQSQKIQKQTEKIDLILGISKGGLIPARILADFLQVSEIITIQVKFYIGIAQTHDEPIIIQPLTVNLSGKKILVVDDIADTGKSLKIVIEHLESLGITEIKTATLYLNNRSVIKPDFYEEITDKWVVFPWEIKETVQKIVKEHKSKRESKREIKLLIESGLPEQTAEKVIKIVQ